MSRWIDADALMDSIIEKWGMDPKYFDDHLDALKDVQALEWINSAPTIDAVSVVRWILCSERLPDKDGEYLVTQTACFKGDENFVSTLYYGKPSMPNIECNEKCFYMSDDEWGDIVYLEDDVIAWMPLPKPYGEREGE